MNGVSGTGIVADGVQFRDGHVMVWPDGQDSVLPAGWCLVRWRGQYRSVVVWPSLADLVAVHGHDGATRVVWLDEWGLDLPLAAGPAGDGQVAAAQGDG